MVVRATFLISDEMHFCSQTTMQGSCITFIRSNSLGKNKSGRGFVLWALYFELCTLSFVLWALYFERANYKVQSTKYKVQSTKHFPDSFFPSELLPTLHSLAMTVRSQLE